MRIVEIRRELSPFPENHFHSFLTNVFVETTFLLSRALSIVLCIIIDLS